MDLELVCFIVITKQINIFKIKLKYNTNNIIITMIICKKLGIKVQLYLQDQ